MSYHRVRGSISYIVGLFSSFAIIFLKRDEPDPFIFGISAFAGFIVFTSITWVLVGLLLNSLAEENPEADPEAEEAQKNLVDFTIDDGPEEQAKPDDDAMIKQQSNPLLESIGPDGKVDWNKLSPIGEDILLEDDFVPLDMFSKNS